MKFYRRWQPVQAMTFDLDDTLYDNRSVIVRAEQRLLDWLEVRYAPLAAFDWSQWQQMRQQVVKDNTNLVGFVTEIRRAQIQLAACRCGLSKLESKHIADDGVAFFLHERSNFTVPDVAFETLDVLSSHYPLVAITNGNVDSDRLGLSPYFKQVLAAGPDGAAKPDGALFIKAQQTLGLPADQILHVGDHLKFDVRGAKLAGFKACWFNDTKKPLTKQRHASLLPDVEIEHIRQLLSLTRAS
ncbi:HAD-IA family hydrolase [Enterovibrio nigricans]|uniref:Putative hydrolase of the HAD superfamily n=1 Tax=Enterovibrio nigricans DSM 22720 TaxID=1121868 RepID=A0A1T4UA84_9GAMM|nr:HAD-IA family hydrolase [Enterovibrio nigricans]PKF51369.1 2-haloalkanoic acid dehalogenase [Enterovibrio nigricans]SKA49438.1 putative hydrolase of the HAD superfamily [Enterovibrio nigricans DSM 22720]